MGKCEECAFWKTDRQYDIPSESCLIWPFVKRLDSSFETMQSAYRENSCEFYYSIEDNDGQPLRCGNCKNWKADTHYEATSEACSEWNNVAQAIDHIDPIDKLHFRTIGLSASGFEENLVCPLFRKSKNLE